MRKLLDEIQEEVIGSAGIRTERNTRVHGSNVMHGNTNVDEHAALNAWEDLLTIVT